MITTSWIQVLAFAIACGHSLYLLVLLFADIRTKREMLLAVYSTIGIFVYGCIAYLL